MNDSPTSGGALNQTPPPPPQFVRPQSGFPQAAPQFAAQRAGNRQQSVSLKILFIILLSLILLIPDMIIYSLNDEREDRQHETTQEISQSWSGPQLISGPIISIPYVTKGKRDKDTTGVIRLLPAKLDASIDVKSRTLSRGIYETTVYNADATLSGEFDMDVLKSTGIPVSTLLLDKAYVTIGIGDLKGVENISSLKLGPDDYILDGTSNDDVYVNLTFNNNTDYTICEEIVQCEPGDWKGDYGESASGCMQAPIRLDSLASSFPYSINMHVKGSQSIGVTPIGAQSDITMTGLCKSPSFAGMVIPSDRTVKSDTFSAKWLVNSINRDYPQAFVGEKPYKISRSAVVTNMLVPVDRYQKTSRAMKYAIIVILLTFISVLFAEIMVKHPINIFQYLLIGLALILFYSLLLSLSEHISFGLSYLIAAVMTIGLVSAYMLGVIRCRKVAVTIGALLTIIYVFIYVLLCLETYALLTGSIGLFIALAAIMYASLKVNGKNHRIW
ncbi:cell envelope integrity protein CreD [uncultured Muribaculum sp.]|uniref:cell envelope integrity protein CreD n=1 Tax=uncultured Muribaculum sp. TaxID=1918613 RepID=UPI0025E0431B|nr:cell envelope integrity protein CreD [uncultured Muribaculum sp.]